MKRVGLVAIALLLGACTHEGAPERVRIIAIHCEPRAGADDCTTIVEFPDGQRFRRSGQWGEVGDTFTARQMAHFDGSRWWQ